jgi:hypothetical protein
MIPVGDDNTARRSKPVVTGGIIALNVLVFAAGIATIKLWDPSRPAARRPTTRYRRP